MLVTLGNSGQFLRGTVASPPCLLERSSCDRLKSGVGHVHDVGRAHTKLKTIPRFNLFALPDR